MNRQHLIEIASGKRQPDLVLKHGKIIQVLTGEILTGDIALCDGIIAGVGCYEGPNAVDLEGKYVSPGFINAHCHVESSMALPEIYCREELRYGVTTVITDPHEIANVAGKAGIQFMLDRSENLPIHYYVQVPSCVPATPFEHAGSILKAEDLAEFLSYPRVTGLGEMMDAKGVVQCRPDVMEKLELFKGKVLDGHLPSAPQEMLQPYAAAGIATDHESVTFGEARDKLRAGMAVLVREGSGSRNLEAIVKGVVEEGLDTAHLAFCTDDKHLLDIHKEGTIRHNIQMAIGLGMNPVTAYQLATINAARIYGLDGIGAIAPGYRADLVILDDLEKVTVRDVYFGGKPVRELCMTPEMPPVQESVRHSVCLPPLDKKSLALPDQEQYPVIQMVENQIITQKTIVSKGEAHGMLEDGRLLKIAVVERHHATGHIGVGLLSRYGLQNGAIATTVAHDSHNLILVGDNDRDMLAAAEELNRVQGGYTLVRGGKVLATLELPIGGLMSEKGLGQLTENIQEMTRIAYSMGVNDKMDPFIALSFLALPVIPEIRITDMGTVEVE
ncbi:adenine deaminase [Solibaculum mannosilyticum]|uniref:adenine deaminase n=1 Tax=Solibaculum mannosilyticum TaxID=2780922 RepID=UPI0007A7FA8C|nr:Adenine deaminase [Eubacteriaceae bacterium CHKCI005]